MCTLVWIYFSSFSRWPSLLRSAEVCWPKALRRNWRTKLRSPLSVRSFPWEDAPSSLPHPSFSSRRWWYDPCLAPLGAPSLWIQYFISMRADGYPSPLERTYTKRAGSCMWRGINLGERVSCRTRRHTLKQPAVPLDQRGRTKRRGTNDPLGSDFRCRYFSFLTVMMMMMIQSHVGYMQQCEMTLDAARIQNTGLSCSFYVGLNIYHFFLKIHIFLER